MSGFKFSVAPLGDILGRRGLEPGGEVQQYIDHNVLRLSSPYVPLDTGAMLHSGDVHTVIGSGEVIYRTPYVRRQYNRGRQPGTSVAGSLRGRKWFERMKADRGKEILAGAARIMKGKG